RYDASFLPESADPVDVSGQGGGQDLDRDSPLQAPIAGLVDRSHAAGSDLLPDPITAQLSSVNRWTGGPPFRDPIRGILDGRMRQERIGRLTFGLQEPRKMLPKFLVGSTGYVELLLL